MENLKKDSISGMRIYANFNLKDGLDVDFLEC